MYWNDAIKDFIIKQIYNKDGCHTTQRPVLNPDPNIQQITLKHPC